jgi:hypothetical protein
MKRIYGRLLSFFISSISISGCCTYGCFVPHGEAYERVISPSTSRSDSWEKPGASEEQKRDDWIACGGKKSGLFIPAFDRKSGEDPNVFYIRASRKFQGCLTGKGYRFTGECIGNMSKFYPVCGAP